MKNRFEYLTDLFIHEITVGIDGTNAKAGAVKVGVSRGGKLSELDKRIYQAGARAALKTGVPIITHLSQMHKPPLTSLLQKVCP